MVTTKIPSQPTCRFLLRLSWSGLISARPILKRFDLSLKKGMCFILYLSFIRLVSECIIPWSECSHNQIREMFFVEWAAARFPTHSAGQCSLIAKSLVRIFEGVCDSSFWTSEALSTLLAIARRVIFQFFCTEFSLVYESIFLLVCATFILNLLTRSQTNSRRAPLSSARTRTCSAVSA